MKEKSGEEKFDCLVRRADKDHDDEISRQDWYDALTTSGVPVTK